MVIAFLRGKNKLFSTSAQQEFIINYAKSNGIAIEMTEIDNDLSSKTLENRKTPLNLLASLKLDDTILIYDLWVFSQKVGELAKVFDCILRHGIHVHVCKQEMIINDKIPSGVLINLLSQQREKNLIDQNSSMGRPKGSFSKSKFDKYKTQIVTMIQEELSVSEIAKRLEISRSSLKDYINSRSLKEIAFSKENKRHTPDENQTFVLPNPDRCPLMEINKKIRKDRQNG